MPKKKKTIEEQIRQGLTNLAVGDVSDAVSLLFLSEDEILQKLPKLNLFNISEIKRVKGGGMEIKFFDRLKAFEKLNEITAVSNGEGLSFYRALEKSVEEMRGEKPDD